jgi:hypothetical protein
MASIKSFHQTGRKNASGVSAEELNAHNSEIFINYRRQAPKASSSKQQASSPKRQAPSFKPQASSSMIREPRNK